jgi:propionyl-CoA synthetase
MNIQDNSRYHQVHARSLADPIGFWGEAAREIDWIEPAKKVFDPATTRSTATSRAGAPTRWR